MSRLDTLMVGSAAAAPRLDAHPVRLGAYRILERLGSGGQAFVYRARRVGDVDGPDVALKRLHPHLADDPNEVRSFGREARIAYLLDHPAIRRVYSLCRERDEVFLVMEYVAGASLKELLKQAHAAERTLPLGGCLAVLHRLCHALHHAHELVDELGAPASIVHRDVSPSNVIVTPAGRIKLIDMGIASSQAAEHVTNSGLVKGKYGYMAPEVMWGAPFDRRADVFSAGVVAWELLTSDKLFPVTHPPLDLERVRSRPVAPPSSRNPACPPALDAIVLRALATSPADRWPTCAAFAEALAVVADRRGASLTDAAIAELAGLVVQPRPRVARGTPAMLATSPTLPMVIAPPPPVRRPPPRVRSATIGALAAATLVAIMLAINVGMPAATPPTAVPGASGADAATDAATDAVVDAATDAAADAAVDAGTDAATDASPPERAPLTVDAADVTRLWGPMPRSRGSTERYRARLCIGIDGAVLSALLLEGPARLQERIERTLSRWRFQPYRDDDGPRPVCFDLESRVQKIPRA